jgi:type VI secretion system protein ImpL
VSAHAEVAAAAAAVSRALPMASGIYALPWYLLLGEPGAGRTTVIRSMNLSWPAGDGPHRIGLPQQLASWWISGEAVLIEPEPQLVGPNADKNALRSFAEALRSLRPREPIDGVLLVISVSQLIDLDERGLEAYAHRLRGQLAVVAQGVRADVPVYVLITRYDTVWGFAEVFQWTPERRREEPWGFLLPGDTTSKLAQVRIAEQLDGLGARFEAFCLAKLSSEDPPDHRARAFQHLAEVRELILKLKALMATLAMESSFERAPWIRALAVGSALPGAGDRPRASAARFANMGLFPPAPTQPARPGGLPLHGYIKDVVLPERELVPLRARWRDKKSIVIPFVVGLVLWLAAAVTALVFALSDA